MDHVDGGMVVTGDLHGTQQRVLGSSGKIRSENDRARAVLSSTWHGVPLSTFSAGIPRSPSYPIVATGPWFALGYMGAGDFARSTRYSLATRRRPLRDVTVGSEFARFYHGVVAAACTGLSRTCGL